jgi:hypothetical protein
MAERWRSEQERSGGRREPDDRMDLDSAGETILGRADWGDRESDYEHGFRPMHGRDDRYAAQREARWPRGQGNVSTTRERGWNDRGGRDWSERGDRGAGDRGGSEYRYAGETALGRADWGDRESDYEHGYRAFREGHWPDSREAQSRGESGPAGDRGEFTGRGPRGYQRNDQRVYEDVCDRLTDDPRVDASDVEVKVENGEVTLNGTVRSRTEKHRAEDTIESISGVRDVHNHLRVSRGHLGEPGAPQTPLGLSQPEQRPGPKK